MLKKKSKNRAGYNLRGIFESLQAAQRYVKWSGYTECIIEKCDYHSNSTSHIVYMRDKNENQGNVRTTKIK